MRKKLTDKQVERVNSAFDRVMMAVDKYLYTCWVNGSPVRTLTVHGSVYGYRNGSTVRYYGKKSK